MIVSATTECFRHLPLVQALDKLVDLEFANVEICICEDGSQIKPSEVLADFDDALARVRDSHRMNIVAYNARFDPGEDYYPQFDAICRLAKATKVVTITVPSAELGTPFNEEVEHLRRLVDIANQQGVRVSMLTQVGRLSEDPDTVSVLCNNVAGLGLTLDPSQYIYGPAPERSYDKVIKYVLHTHLRDSTRDELQVRVGQGEVEYGRLISQLEHENFARALSVDIREMEDVDHFGEMRKLRLLLESSL